MMRGVPDIKKPPGLEDLPVVDMISQATAPYVAPRSCRTSPPQGGRLAGRFARPLSATFAIGETIDENQSPPLRGRCPAGQRGARRNATIRRVTGSAASISAPSPFIKPMNSGKLVAIMDCVVDGHRPFGGEAEHEEGHGDAVVEMGGDEPSAAAAPCRRACRAPRPSSPSDSDAVRLSPRATAARRSLSLTRSSSRPCISVSPSREARGDGEHRIFVDHRRGAACRSPSRPSARSRARAGRDVLAAGARWLRMSMSAAHLLQRQSRPVRVGFSSTFSIVMSEPGTISAATSGERGRGRVARHRDGLAAQLCPGLRDG